MDLQFLFFGTDIFKIFKFLDFYFRAILYLQYQHTENINTGIQGKYFLDSKSFIARLLWNKFSIVTVLQPVFLAWPTVSTDEVLYLSSFSVCLFRLSNCVHSFVEKKMQVFQFAIFSL